MNIVADIKSRRTCGLVHCGYLPQSAPFPTVASSFSLSPDVSNYHQIVKSEALQILTLILHRDMAYHEEIMPEETAAALSATFLQSFEDESATFFTNADYTRKGGIFGKQGRFGPTWYPVTKAAFDAGVIVLSKTQCACLWIEDED